MNDCSKINIKAEYLYVDFGSPTYAGADFLLNVAPNIATIIHDHGLLKILEELASIISLATSGT